MEKFFSFKKLKSSGDNSLQKKKKNFENFIKYDIYLMG